MARILTTHQAAEKLQVKPLTIRKYLRSGVIPGRKLGREWRILETDLERMVSAPAPPKPSERVSALGFLKQFAGSLSSEAFMAEKHAEVEEEERRMEERFRQRRTSPNYSQQE